MMLVSLAYNLTGDAKYLDAVRLSMDYLMGRNPLNHSYVTGYGEYATLHPHHRFWANDPGNGYPPPPAGAISGGPFDAPQEEELLADGVMDEAPEKRYADILGSASTNEVTINWNAPLVWMATFLEKVK
jgi:endoglucanase